MVWIVPKVKAFEDRDDSAEPIKITIFGEL